MMVEVKWPDGRVDALSTDDDGRPRDYGIASRLVAAHRSGEVVEVWGIPCRVVDAQPAAQHVGISVRVERP